MNILVKPKKGIKLRNPATGRELAEAGEEMLDSIFWRRREMDGDVVISEVKDSKAADKEGKSK